MKDSNAEYIIKMNSKGRISLPAEIAGSFGETAYITIDVKPGLRIMTELEYHDVCQKAEEMPKQMQMKLRPLFLFMHHCKIYNRGLFIPKKLRTRNFPDEACELKLTVARDKMLLTLKESKD